MLSLFLHKNYFIHRFTEHSQTSLIAINEIIRNKNPKLYKHLPNFIIHYLKRIIRQYELNDFIKKTINIQGLNFYGSRLNILM